jgi:hypothetical protein
MLCQRAGAVHALVAQRIRGRAVRRIIGTLLVWAGAASAANIPAFPIDTTSSEYARFVSYVDQALAGNPDYGYSPTDAIIRYNLTGKAAYADLAIAGVDAQVRAAESTYALGERPEVAFDSYLYVGEMISALALTYDWAYNRLTPSQQTRWKAYADQTLYNVWNPTKAAWGSASMPWSGWSIDNPGNNYHYSFLEATMYWAVASRSEQWLSFIRDKKASALSAYFATLPGGGSLEGTGYGTSHKRLFDVYSFWKNAMGQDLSAQSTHCVSSIDYWVHATAPALDRFAPIGDQARVSDAPLYDYQRALVIKAVLLNPGTPQAGRGMWWLGHIKLSRMSSTFNLRDAIYRLQDAAIKPTALVYYSPRVGDLFARSSWDTGATWLHVKAGLFVESHAHQDQGSFSIFNGDWLAITENIHTHSGIEQGTEVHNVLRFETENGSDTIGQTQSDSAARLSYRDEGRVLTVNTDLSNMYVREPRISMWKRCVVFDRQANTVTVLDTCGFQTASLNAVWQVNVPIQPTVQGDSAIAGMLVVKPLDADAKIRVQDWHNLSASASWTSEYRSGWKIEISRPNTAVTFGVQLRVKAATTWTPAAASRKASQCPYPNNQLKAVVHGTHVLFGGIGPAALVRVFDSRGRMVAAFSGRQDGGLNMAAFGAGSFIAEVEGRTGRGMARFVVAAN